MIETVTFEALEPGPTLLFLGRVHGNEPCGTVAILEAIEKFRSGARVLKQGRVMFVPVCNPKAAELNQRFVDRNLNRMLFPKEHKTAYEDHIDPVLCRVLEQADWLVDLHSYTVGGPPFVLIDTPAAADSALAAATGVADWVYGWAQSYADSGVAVDPRLSQGTTEYARLHGAVSITVECGQHDAPDSIDNAHQIVESALVALGYIDGAALEPAPRIHQMRRAYFKEKEGAFTQDWTQFQAVAEGTPIVQWDDGTVLHAPFDAVFIMPKSWAVVGDEWFYLASLA